MNTSSNDSSVNVSRINEQTIAQLDKLIKSMYFRSTLKDINNNNNQSIINNNNYNNQSIVNNNNYNNQSIVNNNDSDQ